MENKEIYQSALSDNLTTSPTEFWKGQRASNLSPIGYLMFLRDKEMDRLEFEDGYPREEYKGRVFGS